MSRERYSAQAGESTWMGHLLRLNPLNRELKMLFGDDVPSFAAKTGIHVAPQNRQSGIALGSGKGHPMSGARVERVPSGFPRRVFDLLWGDQTNGDITRRLDCFGGAYVIEYRLP